MDSKKTKEDKKKDWQNFIAKLKSLPPEKLSKDAKWVLENEKGTGNVSYDIKALLK